MEIGTTMLKINLSFEFVELQPLFPVDVTDDDIF
jgi:hypothetical protein